MTLPVVAADNNRYQQYIGWVVGIAKQHQLDVTHIADNVIEVTIPPKAPFELFAPVRYTIRLVIPPPPEDWTL